MVEHKFGLRTPANFSDEQKEKEDKQKKK